MGLYEMSGPCGNCVTVNCNNCGKEADHGYFEMVRWWGEPELVKWERMALSLLLVCESCLKDWWEM